MFKEVFNPANYFFNPYALPSLIVGIYCVLLGIFVWVKNRKLVGFSLFVLTFPCGVWLLSVCLGLLSKNIEVAGFWYKFCYIWIPFISVGSFFVALCVTKFIEIKRERILLFTGYIIMVCFAFLAPSTDFLTKFPPRKYIWGFDGNAGIFLFPFICIWAFWALKATYNVYVTYKSISTPLEKKKFRIFFNSYLFGYFAAVDYFGDFGIGVYPAGYIFIAIYISLLAYNMIRYKAFEIETVIHRTILWLLASASIFAPAILILYFTRPLLSKMNVLFLSLLMTLVFYIFKYYQQIIQPRIDRLFRRKKYDYSQILSMLSLSLRGILDIGQLSQKVSAALKEALYLQKIGILIKEVKTENITPLISEGFAMDMPSLMPFDSLITHLKGKPYLESELVEMDPSFADVKQSVFYRFLKEEEVTLVLSLILKDEFIGCIILGKRENLQVYSVRDIEILKNISSEISLYFYNALHHEDILERQRLELEKQRLDDELRLGREIQMSLLPLKPPFVSGLIVEGLMQPAKEIGGDYYDFIALPQEDQLAIVIGDVSGKGVAAGLLMAMAKTAIHTLSQEEISPKQILLRTNQILSRHISGQKFMTLLYLIWQSQSRTLIYSAAGHEYILIYRYFTKELEVVMSGGFMLGMLSRIDNFLEEKQIKLESKDKILLYTDGVTEAENQSGSRFGLDRLKTVFLKYGAKSAQELMQAIKDEVYAFIGDHPQYDDITIVVLEAQ